MVSLKCDNCGYILPNEQVEKFCPNCGFSLNRNPEISTNTLIAHYCPKCGAAIESPNAIFCPSCGSGLKPVAGQDIQLPSQDGINSQSSAVTPIPQQPHVLKKIVAGQLLKSVPFANMIVPGGKISGSIQLRRDGVLFITKAKEVIQSHILDIADVVEESENNVITIAMINGEKRTFSFAGARRWVDKIRQSK